MRKDNTGTQTCMQGWMNSKAGQRNKIHFFSLSFLCLLNSVLFSDFSIIPALESITQRGAFRWRFHEGVIEWSGRVRVQIEQPLLGYSLPRLIVHHRQRFVNRRPVVIVTDRRFHPSIRIVSSYLFFSNKRRTFLEPIVASRTKLIFTLTAIPDRRKLNIRPPIRRINHIALV